MEIYFNGPQGRIEGKYHENKDPAAPVALVLHPDPTQGGNMNNKATYTLYKCIAKAGFSVLRINFPGVGKSSGTRGTGEVEFRSGSAALDWLQQKHPEASHFWIAGFSFGSYVAMQLACRRPEIENFILIAPPVGRFDFSFTVPCPLGGLVIQGLKDEIVDPSKVKSLINQWSQKEDYSITFETIVNANHLFTDYIDDIASIITEYIDTVLAVRISKPVRKKRRRRRKRDRGYEEIED